MLVQYEHEVRCAPVCALQLPLRVDVSGAGSLALLNDGDLVMRMCPSQTSEVRKVALERKPL